MSTLPLFPDLPDPHEARPRTRGECEMRRVPCAECERAGETCPDCEHRVRPCPWYSCQYHLGVDVTPAGSVIVRIPVEMLDKVPHTCALDVADEGPHSLADIGRLIGRQRTDGSWSPLASERVRAVEEEGLFSLRLALEEMGAASDWIDGAAGESDAVNDDDEVPGGGESEGFVHGGLGGLLDWEAANDE